MARWTEFEVAAPELAATVRRCFAVGKHATFATLRRDGAPRINGTEVDFADGDVFLGSMPGAVKAQDLGRDPRFALHSPSVDPPADAPSDWPGEAKLAGVVDDVSDPTTTATDGHRFRLDILEVVWTRVVDNQLEITSWHEGRGLKVRRRD